MLSVAVESLSVKNILKSLNTYKYLTYRTVLIIPFIVVLLILNLVKLDFSHWKILLGITFFATLNQHTYFSSLGKLNVVIHSMLRGIDIILTAFLLFVFGAESISPLQTTGVILVFMGLYLSMMKSKVSIGSVKIDKTGFILCLVSVIASSFTALITKQGLNMNVITPYSVVFLEFIGVLVYSLILLLTKKSDFSEFKTSYKGIIVAAACMPILRLSQSYAFDTIGVSITNSIKSLKAIPLYLYNTSKGIEKIKVKKTVGILSSIVGTILVVVY